MRQKSELKFDKIGYWSEIKLDIIKDYASAYSKILAAQQNPRLYHIYIDAFAGAGVHISKSTGEFVRGSPVNALLVKPLFREYHLIDLDQKKIALLKELVEGRSDVHVHEGDGNDILLKDVFPRVLFKDYRRGSAFSIHMVWT
jgi:three-Cys-motif partner protein